MKTATVIEATAIENTMVENTIVRMMKENLIETTVENMTAITSVSMMTIGGSEEAIATAVIEMMRMAQTLVSVILTTTVTARDGVDTGARMKKNTTPGQEMQSIIITTGLTEMCKDGTMMSYKSIQSLHVFTLCLFFLSSFPISFLYQFISTGCVYVYDGPWPCKDVSP